MLILWLQFCFNVILTFCSFLLKKRWNRKMKSVKSSRYYRRELRSSSQTYSPVKALTMGMSTKTVMALKSYQNQAGVLVKNYLFSDPFIPYTSILGGMFLCKMVCSYLSLCVEVCICIFFSWWGANFGISIPNKFWFPLFWCK